MSRIKIKDLPADTQLSQEELKAVVGGITTLSTSTFSLNTGTNCGISVNGGGSNCGISVNGGGSNCGISVNGGGALTSLSTNVINVART